MTDPQVRKLCEKMDGGEKKDKKKDKSNFGLRIPLLIIAIPLLLFSCRGDSMKKLNAEKYDFKTRSFPEGFHRKQIPHVGYLPPRSERIILTTKMWTVDLLPYCSFGEQFEIVVLHAAAKCRWLDVNSKVHTNYFYPINHRLHKKVELDHPVEMYWATVNGQKDSDGDTIRESEIIMRINKIPETTHSGRISETER